MGIPLSSIGIITSYATESTAGTRPTTGYTKLPDLKSMPGFNPAPNTADASTFDNIDFTTFIELLKDLGGALEIKANFTEELYTKWGSMCSVYEALTGDKRMWFCFDIPGFSKSVYIAVKPSKMGIPEVEVNSLIETTLYITPIGEPVFDADPTYATSNP